MAETLTIRLNHQQREFLERAAKEQGIGLSSYVRQLAEAEAKRLRNAEIRRQGELWMKELKKHPEALQVLEQQLDEYTDAALEIWPPY